MTKQIYQIQISLQGSKPMIWRRILIHSDISLVDFHKIIQTVMGWTNSHVHQFAKGEDRYSPREFGVMRNVFSLIIILSLISCEGNHRNSIISKRTKSDSIPEYTMTAYRIINGHEYWLEEWICDTAYQYGNVYWRDDLSTLLTKVFLDKYNNKVMFISDLREGKKNGFSRTIISELMYRNDCWMEDSCITYYNYEYNIDYNNRSLLNGSIFGVRIFRPAIKLTRIIRKEPESRSNIFSKTYTTGFFTIENQKIVPDKSFGYYVESPDTTNSLDYLLKIRFFRLKEVTGFDHFRIHVFFSATEKVEFFCSNNEYLEIPIESKIYNNIVLGNLVVFSIDSLTGDTLFGPYDCYFYHKYFVNDTTGSGYCWGCH